MGVVHRRGPQTVGADQLGGEALGDLRRHLRFIEAAQRAVRMQIDETGSQPAAVTVDGLGVGHRRASGDQAIDPAVDDHDISGDESGGSMNVGSADYQISRHAQRPISAAVGMTERAFHSASSSSGNSA
ncbi:hypothetical protein SDC9_103058 [bioreactor metagenome]|uniref:Uncharacterized protein n=1 Tax=bioreactor metagenome TaxID=1076179 RepID=A0A645ATM4_9ZZZZ